MFFRNDMINMASKGSVVLMNATVLATVSRSFCDKSTKCCRYMGSTHAA